jgi:hypothetical protein
MKIDARVNGHDPPSELSQHVGGHPRATSFHASPVVFDFEAPPFDERPEVGVNGLDLEKGAAFGRGALLIERARGESPLRARDASRSVVERGDPAHHPVEGECFLVVGMSGRRRLPPRFHLARGYGRGRVRRFLDADLEVLQRREGTVSF